MRPRIKTLQQRFMVFMVLPVALLLFATGFVGFFYARDALLEQWEEAAILRLQRPITWTCAWPAPRSGSACT